ncbi:hypothetical protein GGI04_003409 [Coemansia thaxteri]|nr:hypothetical protein GGI04_003409 [Coemansia thaxteri]
MPQSFSKHEGVSQPYRENSSHSHRYANDRSSPGLYSHKPYDRPASTHGLPNVAPSAHHPHSARTNYSLDRSSHTRFHIPSGFKTKAQAKKDTTPSSDFQQSLPSKNPQNLAGTKKIPNSSNVGTALTCKYSSTRTYWCDLPGQGLLIEFGDSWILELVNDGGDREANCVGSGKAQRWKVAVPGICPFHVVAKKQTNNVTDCGGIAGHSHEPLVAGPKHNVAVTGSSLMLKQPLVTMPMPMHALLMSSELRSSSLYYYLDPTFKTKYPDFYANLAGTCIIEL